MSFFNEKGLQLVFGADFTDFDRKVNSSTGNLKKLSKESRELDSSMKYDGKSIDLVAQKYKVLQEQIKNTEAKLTTLKGKQEQVNAAYKNGEIDDDTYRRYNNELATTEQSLKRLKTDYENLGKELNNYNPLLDKVSGGFNKVGDMANKAADKMKWVSVAASGALIGVGKAAIDFESAFAGVEKTVDGTTEQIDGLREGIKQMSKEIPSSTTEIAGVAEAAGQLGIETDNVLEFTRVMIDMGQATNLSADVAATTLARFANVTKMSQKDFDRLGSTIVALGNNFATTESEIAAMGMNLGSAGTQIGLTQPQIMGLAAALSSVGLESAAGGTAFSKLMIEMQLAVETGSGSLEDFAKVAKMSSSDFQTAFKEDAAGALIAFIDGLSKTGEQGESAIKVLDDMGITETRLRDTLLRSANASGILTDALGMADDAWTSNNALTEEADKRYGTTASKIEIMKNQIQVAAINLGEKLLPYVQKAITWFTDLIDRFDNLSPGMQDFILKTTMAAAVSAPLLKVVGSLSNGLGGLVGSLGKANGAFKALKGGASIGSSALASVGTSAAATTAGTAAATAGAGGLITTLGGFAATAAPFVLGAAAIGAAGYGIYKSLSEDAVPAVELFADAVESSVDSLDAYGNTSTQTYTKISDSLKNGLGSYMEYSDGVKKELTNLYVGTENITAEGMEKMKNQTTESFGVLIAKTENRKAKDLEILNSMFAESKGITTEEMANMNAIISEGYDTQISTSQTRRDELNKIFTDLATGEREMTKGTQDYINSLLQAGAESAVDIYSENELERNTILDRMNDYQTRNTAESAAEVVTLLNQQRDDLVATAQSEYDERMAIAQKLRKDGSEEAQKMADQLETTAQESKREQINAAEGLRAEGLVKLGEGYDDLWNKVDINTGQMKSTWSSFSSTITGDSKRNKDDITSLASTWNSANFITKQADFLVNIREQVTGKKHNNGLKYVPYDNYQSLLHKGERVLKAHEALEYNKYESERLGGMVSNVAYQNSAAKSDIETVDTKQSNKKIVVEVPVMLGEREVARVVAPIVDKEMGR